MRGRFTVRDMNTVRKLGLVVGIALTLVVAAWHAPGAAAAGGPTSTSISFSSNPASAGQPVTVKVTVTGTLFSPLGGVVLFDGDTALGLLLLTPDFDGSFFCDACIPTDHSSATITRSFGRGDHIFTALYSGDPEDFSSGGGPTTLTVNAAASATVISSSVNPSVHGQNVTFTATVGSTGESPSGTIQFKVDGNAYGAAQTLDSGGRASIVASDLDVGAHTIIAVFTSDNPDVLGSTGLLLSGIIPVKQQVDPAQTSTSVSSSKNPSEFGDTVTFTSTTSVVSPGAGRPTGTVQFEDGGAPLGTPQTLDGSGQASLTTSALDVGAHTINAVYTSDDVDFDGSTGSVDETVDRAATTLVYDGATTSDFDDLATLSARLVRTNGGAPIPGKTIGFTMGSGTCSSDDGRCRRSELLDHAAGSRGKLHRLGRLRRRHRVRVGHGLGHIRRHEGRNDHGLYRADSDSARPDGHAQWPAARGRCQADRGPHADPDARRGRGSPVVHRPHRRNGERTVRAAGGHRRAGTGSACRPLRRRRVLPSVVGRRDGDRVRFPLARSIRARRHHRRARRPGERHLLELAVVERQHAHGRRRPGGLQGLRRRVDLDAAGLRRHVVDRPRQQPVSRRHDARVHGHTRHLVGGPIGQLDLG